MKKSHIDIINQLAEGELLTHDEWMVLLSTLDVEEREYLRSKAQEVAVSHYGKGIFVRALLEISSYCKNNCYYCGIRASNRNAQRYRLTKEEILECCKEADALGFNTFVLQGGEDPVQNDAWVVDVVHLNQSEERPDCG